MESWHLHQSNSWMVVATVMVLTPISTILVVARVYSSHFMLRRRLHLGDWLSVICLAFLWLGAAFATKLSLSGGGRHWALLTDTERTNTRFWYWVWSLPAGFVLSVPNMAVASLLCRVFKPRRVHRVALWSIAVICNINFVLGSIIQLFRCKPLRTPWNADAVSGEKCWDQWIYIKYCLYAAVYSAIADLCLAVYPALVIRQMPWSRQKISLYFMLGLSIFAIGVACYKISFLKNIASDDFSYDISDLVIWTMLEGYVILIAACVPTLHPIYDRLTELSSNITRGRLPHTTSHHHHHHHNHRAHNPDSASKLAPWSAMKTSFRASADPVTMGSRGWIVNGGRTVPTREVASPRSLEDAANLAYPPAAIWKQTVRVGQHSRIRPQDYEPFY